LTIAIQRGERVTEDMRQIQSTLDQGELELHTVQNEKVHLAEQQQHQIITLREEADQ